MEEETEVSRGRGWKKQGWSKIEVAVVRFVVLMMAVPDIDRRERGGAGCDGGNNTNNIFKEMMH